MKIRNTISGRLTLQVLFLAALVFLAAFLLFFRMSGDKVRDEAFKHAESELSKTVYQIDGILHSVETAVENTAWLVNGRLDSPGSMYELVVRLLENNSFIYGSAIAFEPGYFQSEGHFFSPYSFRAENGDIEVTQLGNKDYDYHYMDWYQIPKLLDQPYWTEPYYDDGGGEMMMTTYSKPLYDGSGRMIAVITADISLNWLTSIVNDLHAFETSYNMMVSRNASYIVHPDPDLLLNETVYSSEFCCEEETLMKMQEDMINGRSGQVSREMDGKDCFVFYAPVKATGWSVAVVCPRDEVYAGVRRLSVTMIIVALAALLLMIVMCYRSIRRITSPIEDLTSAANRIAGGDFNVPLPEIRSNDELKTLNDSFEYMQKSLTSYIEELKVTTAGKERIESELRIASTIQMGMLPKIFPPFPERDDLDLYASLVPAKEVGGDLYDFFINDEKLYFIVGDVSGKGVPASLVMAVTCRLFRTIADHCTKAEEIISALNDSLSENNESNMFCTAFLGILDLRTGTLDFCNAGHNAPVLFGETRAAEFVDVKPNLPLGVFEGFPYEGQTMNLERGTTFFLYTDGVTEAENPHAELYSDERLVRLLNDYRKCDPKPLITDVFKDIASHVDGALQSDDITVMAFKYR